MRSLQMIAVLLPLVATAQAPLPVEKEGHHKLLFKSDTLRILEVNVPEGMETLDHLHSNDIITVCIECADNTRTRAPGEPWSDVRVRRIGSSSIAEYSGKPAAHAVRNVGPGGYRLFAVENLRQSGWSLGTKLTAPATTLAEESRSFRIYDVRLGSNTTTAHIHAVPTVVVLVAGTVLASGSGKSTTLQQPGQWELIAPTQAHVLSAADGNQANLVEIEIR